MADNKAALPDTLQKRLDEALAQIEEYEATLKTIREQMDAKKTKMFDLVCLARSKSCDPKIECIRNGVYEKYPQECSDLGGDDGDWHHGFNSGVLATARLVGGIMYAKTMAEQFREQHLLEVEEELMDKADIGTLEEYTKNEVDRVIEEFPFLDT